MEHLVEGLADDVKLLGASGHPEGVVEALVEEGVLGVEPEDLAVVEGVGEVELHVFFVLLGVVHLLALLDEPLL